MCVISFAGTGEIFKSLYKFSLILIFNNFLNVIYIAIIVCDYSAFCNKYVDVDIPNNNNIFIK